MLADKVKAGVSRYIYCCRKITRDKMKKQISNKRGKREEKGNVKCTGQRLRMSLFLERPASIGHCLSCTFCISGSYTEEGT